ncbi:MAG: phosphoribosylanthranilate isomerase [bacterium]|nr:phosphoribosylanthranilate isomerase [bacterium]
MTKVKICGITSDEVAHVCCHAGADMLGFNFVEEAKRRNRYISPDNARAIIETLPPFVSTVAVCVNEPPERLAEYLEFLDYVQLHGEEPAEVANQFGRRAIKAFRVGPDFDPASMLAYDVGAYLLDAYVPGSAGGTGKTFDWAVAEKAVNLGRPLMLAGGLTPENVGDAVAQVRPYAVDTAGGVESAPGKKDHDTIRRFIFNAKRALPVS